MRTKVRRKEQQRRKGSDRRQEEKIGRKEREDELNKRLNNTHQGLINCCSMGATS